MRVLVQQIAAPGKLCPPRDPRDIGAVTWTEPYLETCCRSALHRLLLCDGIGRPADQKDGPCLARLAGMDLARTEPDGRFQITQTGRARHAVEVT